MFDSIQVDQISIILSSWALIAAILMLIISGGGDGK